MIQIGALETKYLNFYRLGQQILKCKILYLGKSNRQI